MTWIAEASFAAQLQRLVLFPSCKEGMHTSSGRNDYGLSVAINNLLKAVAKQITVLNLRLKTVFSREFDEDGYDELYVFPTLPQMLKLKTFVFSAANADDVTSLFDCNDKLQFVFEETQRGCNEVSQMAQLFPSLESLTIVEIVDVYILWDFLSPNSQHFGVKEFCATMNKRTDNFESERVEKEREAKLCYPNATVVLRKVIPLI